MRARDSGVTGLISGDLGEVARAPRRPSPIGKMQLTAPLAREVPGRIRSPVANWDALRMNGVRGRKRCWSTPATGAHGDREGAGRHIASLVANSVHPLTQVTSQCGLPISQSRLGIVSGRPGPISHLTRIKSPRVGLRSVRYVARRSTLLPTCGDDGRVGR